ncbi:MAG: general secretion pathway protein [Burkholderiaceae bacterium]|nr:general secretion pathway protein [Burkholderiaceae bacterium]MCD8517717.1 general secretion pathway protein [Burkholderiaceae bacterium]MCD8536008.1 general secretion pathway protein [Burkholderiaceae bacterium]MCD8564713.1 general secretion pathway protein [Burkholderiaceae bacterium]
MAQMLGVKDFLVDSISLGLRISAWRFARQRADYYEFLGHLLDNRALEQTLLLTFEQDSWRHGYGSARGKLAAWWAARYAASGGDLVYTWQGTLPASDLQTISLAQDAGQAALVQTLKSMATQVRLWNDCTGNFWQTIAVGMVAAFVALACLFVMPLWTAPRLTGAFGNVPVTYYGPALKGLLGWVAGIKSYWLGWIGAFGVGIAALWWSLTGLTGPVRRYLDRLGIWRLYRDLNAMRFLTGSATLLNALSPSGVSLRTVLATQQRFASRWLNDHLNRMVMQLDAGADALTSLNTGLLADDVWWRFVDAVRVHGLAQGLGTASGVIGQLLKSQMARRALVLRWVLLMTALACVMAVGFWHLRAIEELRQGLTLFYSLS